MVLEKKTQQQNKKQKQNPQQTNKQTNKNPTKKRAPLIQGFQRKKNLVSLGDYSLAHLLGQSSNDSA